MARAFAIDREAAILIRNRITNVPDRIGTPLKQILANLWDHYGTPKKQQKESGKHCSTFEEILMHLL